MSQAGRCKGSILVHLRAYAEKSYGVPAWQSMLADATPEDRAILDGIVIAGGWYPVGVWNRALGSLLARHTVAIDAEMRKVASYIADRDLNSVYKMILRLGSPEFLLRRTDSLWSRYFDSGRFTHEELGAKRFKLLLEAPRTADSPDRLTCGPGVSAWIEMGMKNTGVEGRVQHVDCRFENGQRCEYIATW
jgi:hypothetical protein